MNELKTQALVIDDEFKSLIPPLSPDEYTQLEKNILKDGIRDPLVVWPQKDGKSILLDGHNRLEIANSHHGIKFTTIPKDFESRNDAIRWIILNQFGRRNLSAYDRSILALKLEPVIAEKQRQKQVDGGKEKVQQKSVEPTTTQKELAKVAGVSHDTIHKVKTIEAKAPPIQKEQVRSGEKSINRVYNEVMDREIKRPPSAKEYVEQAKERHEDFKEQTVVTVSDIQQERKDKEILEQNAIREVKKVLGHINDLCVLIDAGEIPVSVLSEDGRTKVLSTLNAMHERIHMIETIIEKR